MNCPHCNAPLMIEDEVCPYCGQKNPYFTKHREQMKEFGEEFAETQQEVVETAKHTTRFTAGVAVVFALIALNLLVLLGTANCWRINSFYRTWKTDRNETEIRATLQEYSDANDPIGMFAYFQKNVYGYDTFWDYNAVEWALRSYYELSDYIMQLALYSEDNYRSPETLAEYISTELGYFYLHTSPDEYSDPEQFTAERQASIDMITVRLEALLETYLDIAPEDIPALIELSDARRAVAIEESYLKKGA